MKNFTARDFINKNLSKLNFPKTVFYEANGFKQTICADVEFDEKMKIEIEKEFSRLHKPNPVFWLSGRKQGRPKMTENISTVRTDLAKPIITYLNRNRIQSYHINIKTLIEVEAHINATRSNEKVDGRLSQRFIAIQHAAAINDHGKPQYIQGWYSNRIYGWDYNLQGCPSDIRARLYPDWFELDLKSCQLAILAKKFNLTKIIEKLNNPNYSIWKELGVDTSPEVSILDPKISFDLSSDSSSLDVVEPLDPLSISIPVPPETENQDFTSSLIFEDENIATVAAQDFSFKAVFKQALYACCFGMSRTSISKELNHLLGKGASKLFWKSDVIVAIYDAAQLYMDNLVATGAAKDKRKARSMLACEAQATELELISEVYKLASQTDRWRIMLHSHDGVSIKVRDETRSEQIIQSIKDTINPIYQSIGIPTKLESSQPSKEYIRKPKFRKTKPISWRLI